MIRVIFFIGSCFLMTDVAQAESTTINVEVLSQRAYDLLKQGRYAEALPLCQYLSEKDNAIGQTCLGVFYDFGQGVAQNDTQAVYWYTKAAEQGNPVAQGNLGYLYHEGRGVTQNDNQAVFLYNKSAAQGYATAQVNLAYLRHIKQKYH